MDIKTILSASVASSFGPNNAIMTNSALCTFIIIFRIVSFISYTVIAFFFLLFFVAIETSLFAVLS
jgi:hypothetical protein